MHARTHHDPHYPPSALPHTYVPCTIKGVNPLMHGEWSDGVPPHTACLGLHCRDHVRLKGAALALNGAYLHLQSCGATAAVGHQHIVPVLSGQRGDETTVKGHRTLTYIYMYVHTYIPLAYV